MPAAPQPRGGPRTNLSDYLHNQLLIHLGWNRDYVRHFTQVYGADHGLVQFFELRCQWISVLIEIGRREETEEDRLIMFDFYRALVYSDRLINNGLVPL